LAALRGRVRRFKAIGKTLQKLFCPALEETRKMQKTVYRVRTQERIQGRTALDMQCDAQASDLASVPRPEERCGGRLSFTSARGEAPAVLRALPDLSQ
jgi:hypothetical protein